MLITTGVEVGRSVGVRLTSVLGSVTVGMGLAVTGIVNVLVGVIASIVIVGVIIVAVTEIVEVGSNSKVGTAVDDGITVTVVLVGNDVGEARLVTTTVALG